jgi:hypothetical protein
MATQKRAVRKNAPRKRGTPLRQAQAESIHTLKVTLRNVRPPIWRRILVPGHATLGQLHDILQGAMGWGNGHLHQFTVGDIIYSAPRFELDAFGDEVEDERTVTVAEVLPQKGSRALYEYDFGDGWEHLLLVEKVGPREAGVEAPLCIAGARACPPEDSGGPWGYGELLELLRNSQHEEHAERLEWVGGGFDPEAFDVEAVNRRLRNVR